MTDTSKEAVERMATGYEEGLGDSFRATAATLRALLSERDTAFNDGIEAVLQHKRFVLPIHGDGEEMVPVKCIESLKRKGPTS